MDGEPKTWILTGSLENFLINVERGFDVIGFKQGRRNQAMEFEPGDEIVFYVTGVQAFGGMARVTSAMFEDRSPIWPQGKKKKPEPKNLRTPSASLPASSGAKAPESYPWRVHAEPVLVLDEAEFVPAESFLGDLEHLAKWPEAHWHLAFQGQLRVVSPADAAVLRDRMGAAVSERA
jgi:EVE domain-containing protein